jgi:hypothetical protein
MRRQYEDHEHDSTYLSRDQLAEAGKAYKLISSTVDDINGTVPHKDSSTVSV